MLNKYKDVYAATSEVLGMALSFMEDNNNVRHTHSLLLYTTVSSLQPFLHSLQELVSDQLILLAQPAAHTEDKFLTALHKLQLHYPKMTNR